MCIRDSTHIEYYGGTTVGMVCDERYKTWVPKSYGTNNQLFETSPQNHDRWSIFCSL